MHRFAEVERDPGSPLAGRCAGSSTRRHHRVERLGSRLVAANVPRSGGAATALQDHIPEAQDNWRKHGFDIEMCNLWYVGERHDVSDYLGDRGWTV